MTLSRVASRPAPAPLEAQWIDGAVHGDAEAFAKLYEAYADRAYRLGLEAGGGGSGRAGQ